MRQRAGWMHYGIAGVAVALATTLKFMFGSALSDESPFLLYFAAVTIVALYAGAGPGLLATATAAAITAYSFFPPYYSFEIHDPHIRLRLLVFVVEALFITMISAALRSAKYRADDGRRAAEAVARVGALISGSLDPAEVEQRMVGAMRELFNAQRAELYALEIESGDLVECAFAVSARSAFAPPSRFPRGTGLISVAVQEQQPVASSDILRDARIPQSDANRAHIADVGSYAVLAVPVMARDSVIGALAILDDLGRRFTPDEIRIAETFATQAAVALANAQRYTTQEVRATRLRTLANLNQLVSASLDSAEVLQRIARAASDLAHAPLVEFWIVDSAARTAELRAMSNPDIGTDRRLKGVRFGQGGIGWVAQHRRSLVIADVSADRRILEQEWFAAHRLTSGCWLPIIARDELLGVLAILGERPLQFGQDERDVIDTFVAQAAVAISNARLYEDLRTTHQQLAQSQAQIVQSERLRALGQMAAGVAHDFNNLLTVIVGRAELLLKHADDPGLRRGLEGIHRAGLDGKHTVRRILEFTRTRTDQAFETVNLRALLLEVIELSRPRWYDEPQSRGVHYDVRVDGADVPPITGRPEELREVFLNLLTNALEAMPGGGACVFHLATAEQMVMVGVQDTGSGIRAETQALIFEPFFTTKGPQSSGLGLAMSWGIIRRHGGSIDVASTPDCGTTMTVQLPVGQRIRAVDAPTSPLEVQRGARILVIEDEDAVRDVLVDALAAEGYIVVPARNGAEALAQSEAAAIDLVMTDLSMPGMSGWDVARAYRSRFPNVPVGVVTGWGDQLDPERLEQYGIRFVVAKPFQTHQILKRVAEALTPR